MKDYAPIVLETIFTVALDKSAFLQRNVVMEDETVQMEATKELAVSITVVELKKKYFVFLTFTPINHTITQIHGTTVNYNVSATIFSLFTVSLAQSTRNITKAKIVTPHLSKYNADGYVVFNEKGEIGKLCAENLNDTVLANRSAEILHTVASSLCQSLSYR